MVGSRQTELHEARGARDDMAQAYEEEMMSLKHLLAAEKEKARKSWKTNNCEHLAEQDTIIMAHEEEITKLKEQIVSSQTGVLERRDGSEPPPLGAGSSQWEVRHPTREPPASGHSDAVVPSPGHVLPEVGITPATLADDPMRPGAGPTDSTPSSHHESGPLTHPPGPPDGRRRQGKAPPIEFFSGEDPAILLDDWLPSLERASSWNGWSAEDQLMQLSGYLRGRALQEWRLLPSSEQKSYSVAIEALRMQLDPGSKMVTAQEFRHSLQRSGEGVSDFIRRLEKTFLVAYGRDDLNTATRDALLKGCGTT